MRKKEGLLKKDYSAAALRLIDHDPDRSTSDSRVYQALSRYIGETGFKRVLNRIVAGQAWSDFKSVAVLSEFAGEGKSFFVSALGLAYARYLSSRVLVMETTRQSSNDVMYFKSISGVHDGEVASSAGRCLPGVIDIVSTDSGGGDASFNLQDNSDFRIAGYIESVRERYDIVIVDTCAMRSASRENIDPLIVARGVDAAILVTSQISHQRSMVFDLRRKLMNYHVELLGVVFNPEAGARG